MTADDPRPAGEAARHNHFTRDIKAPGKCPACDRILHKAAETLPIARPAASGGATDGELRCQECGELVPDYCSGVHDHPHVDDCEFCRERAVR